jgi:hypothetical protein
MAGAFRDERAKEWTLGEKTRNSVKRTIGDAREILHNQSLAIPLTHTALVAVLARREKFQNRTSRLLKGEISSHDQ